MNYTKVQWLKHNEEKRPLTAQPTEDKIDAMDWHSNINEKKMLVINGSGVVRSIWEMLCSSMVYNLLFVLEVLHSQAGYPVYANRKAMQQK